MPPYVYFYRDSIPVTGGRKLKGEHYPELFLELSAGYTLFALRLDKHSKQVDCVWIDSSLVFETRVIKWRDDGNVVEFYELPYSALDYVVWTA